MNDPRAAFPLHSAPVAGAIADLPPMTRSLLFAELAKIAYLDPPEAADFWAQLGFFAPEFVERDGAQAYVLDSVADRVVAFRGTEPDDLNDLKADIDALSAIAETVGRVHRGFKREADDIWPFIRAALDEISGTLWLTGHSLGGAIATITAARAQAGMARNKPRGLYTYGSPRVGDHPYCKGFAVETVRWVNNNDIVTRLPPAWFGYRHVGVEHYLDSTGRHRQLSKREKARDRLRGFLGGFRQGQLDPIHDHGIDTYIAGIAASG